MTEDMLKKKKEYMFEKKGEGVQCKAEGSTTKSAKINNRATGS